MNTCGLWSDSYQIWLSEPLSEQYKRFTVWYMTADATLFVLWISFVPEDEISTPQGCSLVLITPKGYKDLEFYVGDDAITHFLSRALEIANKTIRNVYEINLPVEATAEQM